MANEELPIKRKDADSFIDNIRERLEGIRSFAGLGVVHTMVGSQGEDGAVLLRRILSMGVNPDLPDEDDMHPSHLAGLYAKPQCALVIAACRPNLKAVNFRGETPLQQAATQIIYEVITFRLCFYSAALYRKQLLHI